MPKTVAKQKKQRPAHTDSNIRSYSTIMPDGRIGVVRFNVAPVEEVPSPRRTTREIVDEFLRDTPLHLPEYASECADQLLQDMARARLSKRAKWLVYDDLCNAKTLPEETLSEIFHRLQQYAWRRTSEG